MRDKIILACTECKQRNYSTKKNKKNTPDKLRRRKYDPVIRQHVEFVEAKIK